MDKNIEAVKEILADFGAEVKTRVDKGKLNELPQLTDNATKEICQLFPRTKDNPDGFEPKPVVKLSMGGLNIIKPKPDESRLLTADEFTECGRGIAKTNDVERAGAPWIFGAKLIEAQDAKTASIKDQKHGEQLERIKKQFENYAYEVKQENIPELGSIPVVLIHKEKLEALWKEEIG